MKKIGILANTYGAIIGTKYLKLIKDIGAMPYYIPYMKFTTEEKEEILSQVDGLIVPGGIDVSPRTYKTHNLSSENVNHKYDKWQLEFIHLAYTGNKKIFGICRGHQLINVYFGGTLVQDVDANLEPTIEHNQSVGKNQRYELTHMIKLHPKAKLPKWIKYKSKDYVNSFHHQAVTIENIGSELIPLFGIEDIIEVMMTKDEQVLTVQFHPEEFEDGDEKATIETLKNFFGLISELDSNIDQEEISPMNRI